MIDLDKVEFHAEQLCFSSDTSAAENLGFGAVFNHHLLFNQWEAGYIKKYKPSIEYLELFAVVAAILTWGKELKNIRMFLYCDNAAVISMINSMTSSCKNCMYLIYLLALDNLIHSRRTFMRHLRSKDNYLSDALSRIQLNRFWKLAPPGMDAVPSPVAEDLWPASKI